MKTIRFPGILAYAAMLMWLLQVIATPAGAEERNFVGAPISDFSAAISDALQSAGAPAGAKLTLETPSAIITLTPGGAPQFDHVAYNAASGRFIMRANGADGTPALSVAGRAILAVTLPVLAHDIQRNDVITEADLDWTQSTDVDARLYLDDADQILGKVARRPLAKGDAIRKLDLVAPILVKKGALVTVALEAPGLRLTQMGVALDQGAEGDLIRIKNVNSGREISAVVAGENVARAPFRSAASTALSFAAN